LIASDLIKKLPRFKTWLVERGAEVLEPTNEYEMVRFKTGKGTSVIYRKKSEASSCSFIGEAETAWREYKSPGSTWRAIPATKRQRGRSSVECVTIRKRDGDNCFLCGHYVSEATESVEHLVALTHGGTQHISNKFLAHEHCNKEVGHKSAVEKIKIHDKALMDRFLREYHVERRQTPRGSSSIPSDGNIGQENQDAG
jgi:5-methylcytosine-specific restriction endonuclease McrA